MSKMVEAITRSVGRKKLVLKKQSPNILFVGGVIGVIGSAVLACKATLKLEETLDTIKEDVTRVKLDEFPIEKEHTQALGRVYVKSGIKLVGLYGPSVVVGVASLSALTGSHIQLVRRNQALSLTLTAVTTAYEEYRARVQQEIGEERELELYRNLPTIDDKTKEITQGDITQYSPHAVCFDESNVNWERNAETNLIFLKLQQNYANHKLAARGHLFLNEVYDALGFDRTPAGQVLGWVYNGSGANYVDFGTFAAQNDGFGDFEQSAWLDFNVDGVVYDKI